MPEGLLAIGLLLGHGGVVKRLRDRANGINGAPHGQLLALGVSQGEIDGATGAVGWWGGGALARRGPETPHVFNGSLAARRIRHWIHPAPVAFLADGVVDHKGLDGHGPPGIKDSELPLGLMLLQDRLRLKQSIHDPLA
jgi:hypothetical protein